MKKGAEWRDTNFLTPEDYTSLINRYPLRSSLIMPLLHILKERRGYLTEEDLRKVSEITGESPALIKGVGTFYSFYNFIPQGGKVRYFIQICRNVACMVAGADRLIDHLIKRYELIPAEELKKTSGPEIFHYKDPSIFSLMITECLGACGIGPAMLVNGRLFGRLDIEKIEEIMDSIINGSFDDMKNGQSTLSQIDVFPMEPESLLLKTLDCIDIDSYREKGGYTALKKAFQLKPEEIIDLVKASGLRGRGGAGFPTGMKWAFARQDPKRPKYLIANADEGEPGTYKDRIILGRNPHQLVEGMIISAYAIGAEVGYIYLRYEYPEVIPVLEEAIRSARSEGYLGENILGTGFNFDIFIHRGAGAYICGEETALIESLEGKRGQPRIRPPFPVNSGLSGRPTVVNNVETIANIPVILNIGATSYQGIGSKDAPGPKLFSISGVRRPGVYEVPTGITLRELIQLAGGADDIKAVIPGGLSTPVLTAADLDCPLDFSGLASKKSMLGTGAVMVFSSSHCMVRIAMRAMSFYRDESCGKCTPCREGTGWLENILKRIEDGRAGEDDLELLEEICGNISGKTFCALGDAAACVVTGMLRHFKDEFKEHIRLGRCPIGEETTTVTSPPGEKYD